MKKKFLKLFVSIAGLSFLIAGCSSKVREHEADSETKIVAQTEKHIESDSTIETLTQEVDSKNDEADYVINALDDTGEMYHSRAEEVVKSIKNNDFGDTTVERYTASDYEITIGAAITIYEDGDFMFVIMFPEGGMQQLDGKEMYTLDGGKTWNLRRFHRLCGTTTYIIDKKIITVQGMGLMDVPSLAISYDYGETYENLDIEDIENISHMPEIYGMVDLKVKDIDSEHDKITFEWYLQATDIAFYREDVSLSSWKVLKSEDIYHLADIAKKYKETDYIYKNSSTEYLDEAELRTNYANMYIVSQSGEDICRGIRYAINEIYARKGYDFSGTDYERYFKNKGWYSPIPGKEVAEEEINAYEKANIDLLVKIESEYEMLINNK